MKKLKIAPNTTIMNVAEFRKWISNKTIYHHQCAWIEKWTPKIFNKDGSLHYIPGGGFALRDSVKLKPYPYPGYSAKCLGHYTTTGNQIWNIQAWTVKHNDANGLVYVTRR